MMKKIRKEDGFTLAELLIVVAIIAVLVAISIPIFTYQLRKARLATNQGNARAAYASAVAAQLEDNTDLDCSFTYDVDSAKAEKDSPPKETGGDGIDISSWYVDLEFADETGKRVALGDDVAEQWVVIIKDGEVNTIYPKWKS